MYIQRNGGLYAILSLTLAGCATSPPPGAPDQPQPASATAPVATTVLAGVFTAPQAARGQQIFQRSCASCHSPAEFSGPVFQRVWNGRSIGELYHTISTMMPQNDPGGLSPEEYRDVLTYFLRQNGYPEGDVELPADPGVLNSVKFEPAG